MPAPDVIVRRVSYGIELVDEFTEGELVGTSRILAVRAVAPGDEVSGVQFLVGRSRWVFENLREALADPDDEVRFSLPDASSAVLELFDVAGRQVMVKDVGPLGPGEHSLRLAQRGALPPGIYMLRLTRGPQALTSRLSVMR